MTKPLNLASTFVVVEPDQRAIPVAVTSALYDELDRWADGFAGRLLLSLYEFDADWSSWEAHPAGDEIVCLLSGDVTFVLELDGGQQSVRLSQAGEYVVVPKGIWHTARTRGPCRLLFATPGAGTQHRPA